MRSCSADLQKCLRTRSHFLARLRRPRQKCELADDLEESRSTIDRALRELEDAGFVERADRGYRTTLTGELALEAYRRYSARLDGLLSARDALDPLPTDAALDGALFEEATVSLPTSCSPHAPVEALESLLADADHARVFATAVIPAYVDIYHEKIVEEGMTADIVCAEGVFDWILSRREEELAAIAGCDGVTLWETSADRAFSLVVTECESPDTDRSRETDATSAYRTSGGDSDRDRSSDRDRTDDRDRSSDRTNDRDQPTKRVGAMIYDEGQLAGFVHTDARAAVAWGEAVADRLEADAMRLGGPVEG